MRLDDELKKQKRILKAYHTLDAFEKLYKGGIIDVNDDQCKGDNPDNIKPIGHWGKSRMEFER
jgi:hypothetical protein